MESFFSLLFQRLGYAGDPHGLCLSSLPSASLLFVTGCFAILAVSVLLRSTVDIARPQGILQRLASTRSLTQWTITATSVVLLAALLEAVGTGRRANATEWLNAMAPPDRPMTVTGVFAVAAGLLVATRAMVTMQLHMFRRSELAGGRAGMAPDGAFNHPSGISLEGVAGKLIRRPGGGMPAVMVGALLAAYGYELLQQADLCL